MAHERDNTLLRINFISYSDAVGGSYIPWVYYEIASNSYSCSIWVFFVGTDPTDYFCVYGPRKQRVAGTETFKVIRYEDIPQDRHKEVCHTKLVCEVSLHKEEPDRKRITIRGNRIIYPGGVGTPTALLELIICTSYR